jgi:hypothetical protein
LLPSIPTVEFEPSTQVKWKNLVTFAVSRPVRVVFELPTFTVAIRTLETLSTPGFAAIAEAAAGENESQPELVVRM